MTIAAATEPLTQVHGVVIIYDMTGFSLGHVAKVSPSFTRKMFKFMQDVIQINLHGIHMVNQNSFFNMAFAIAKPFINESFSSKIHFHGTDMASMHKFISPEALPKEYGGKLDLPKMLGDEWYTQFKTMDPQAEAFNSYGYKK